jgi:hypothetical protein
MKFCSWIGIISKNAALRQSINTIVIIFIYYPSENNASWLETALYRSFNEMGKVATQVIAFEEIHNYGHPGGCGSDVAGLHLGSGEERDRLHGCEEGECLPPREDARHDFYPANRIPAQYPSDRRDGRFRKGLVG